MFPIRASGSEAEELLGDLCVARGQDLLLVEAARAAARLALEVVAHARLLLHELSAAGDLEALLGTGVGLLLRHLFFLRFTSRPGGSRIPPGRESVVSYSADAGSDSFSVSESNGPVPRAERAASLFAAR